MSDDHSHSMFIGCPWCRKQFRITVTTEEAPPLPPETPIEELDLPSLPYAILKDHGIDTIGQLISRTPASVIRLKRMSRSSLAHIVWALEQRHLSLLPN